ncbi:MAG: helix-turn-helix transcriptional regulator [Deltaproteobacteria bacterium]|nr:helix-turn-helix transcriptional regulator [Deltaproteobacteria bacterium]
MGTGTPTLIEECENAAKMLRALAHPQRLQILCHLSEDELAVSELERRCGASQSAVSQFLARMKAEGLVASRRDGNFVYYRIQDSKVRKLIRAMHGIFCP